MLMNTPCRSEAPDGDPVQSRQAESLTIAGGIWWEIGVLTSGKVPLENTLVVQRPSQSSTASQLGDVACIRSLDGTLTSTGRFSRKHHPQQ